MYAVIKTGGKQYKVSHGHVLRVEKLEAEVGSQVDFTEVLLVSDGSEINVWGVEWPDAVLMASDEEPNTTIFSKWA